MNGSWVEASHAEVDAKPIQRTRLTLGRMAADGPNVQPHGTSRRTKGDRPVRCLRGSPTGNAIEHLEALRNSRFLKIADSVDLWLVS